MEKIIQCFKCHTKLGFNTPNGKDNDFQPPLNFFKYNGLDICAFCFARDETEKEKLELERYEKQHKETLRLYKMR